MKITQDQKNKIILLRDEGKKLREIAEALPLPLSLVHYWSNSDFRTRHIASSRKYFLKLSPEKKKECYRARNEYLKAYNKKKYKEDSVFREKQKERARNNKRKLVGVE